jgi:hypothetical protein
MAKKKVSSNKPWFRKRQGLMSSDLGYGWIPISWEGWTMLTILLVLNFASVFYFNLASGSADSIIKFLTVFFLSVLVFALIAMMKTSRSKR